MHASTATPILPHLHALGDETRIRLLALLDRSEFTVSELCDIVQVAQPTVSRHLRTLADEGWVEARQDGRMRHYRLAASLDDHARALWRIVRPSKTAGGVYAADTERAARVLEHRRLRSAAFFADAAARWDELRTDLFGPAVRFAPLFGLLDADWTVGDLGTGTGAIAGSLAPFVARVIGVDRSADMLAAAKHRLTPVGNVELREGELEHLPLESETLDLALMSLVLQYVVDPPRALSEAWRVLRPGGRLVVLDTRPHDPAPSRGDDIGQAWPGFEPDRITAWLSDAGFDALRLIPLPPDPGARGPLLFLTTARRPAR